MKTENTMNCIKKYRNQKTVINNISFDSKKEAHRYGELLLLEKAKAINNLQRQVKFELLPAQKIGRSIAERAVNYYADFTYNLPDGTLVVEDTKSTATRTKEYIIKRKLMLYIHGISIKEV